MADSNVTITVQAQDLASEKLANVAQGLKQVSGATGGVTDAQQALAKSSGGLMGTLDGLAEEYTGLSLTGLGVVGSLVAIGKKSIEAADSLEGLENRARVIYGDAFPEMEARAESLAQ